MKLLTIDIETFYDNDYSLTKLTTEEYIRSPLFETIGVSVKVDDAPGIWFSDTHDKIKLWLKQFDIENNAVLAQNAHFDGAILEWVFDIHPKRYCDTLSMANATVGISESVSLKNLATLFNVGRKGTEVIAAKGKRRGDFTADELAEYGLYCINDVELTYTIFKAMLNGFTGTDISLMLSNGYPISELKLIDITIKMFTRPVLQLNKDVLTDHLYTVQETKRNLIYELMKSLGSKTIEGLQTTLNSNKQFADILRIYGVNPPTKLSPTTGKETYAFAKTDAGFIELTEHSDPKVQALCLARLGTKSTIEETRTEKFLSIASRGLFPIPLKYSGAHVSHRFSGFDINVQNLPKKSPLREAICAPKGYKLIIVDLSQIELRLGLWLAGQDDKVELLRQGIDLYRDLAVTLFGIPYDQIAKDSMERTVGKVISLAGIYGTGGAKTKEVMRIQAKVITPLEQATQWIQTYRIDYNKVTEAWSMGKVVLDALISKTSGSYLRDGIIQVEMGKLIKPNGLVLTYPNLKEVLYDNKWEYQYDNRNGFVRAGGTKIDRVYSSKVFQRCTQSLARDIMAEQMVEINKKHTVINTVHDELWVLAKEAEAEDTLADVLKCMTTPPKWCASLPLAAEGGIGDNYANAK
jgi:DNA polymerase I-like protein with 3'-5' exonuclease and polymerase domains